MLGLRRFFAAAVLAVLYPSLAAAADRGPGIAGAPCANLSADQNDGSSQFLSDFLQMGIQYHWFGEHPDVEMTVIKPEAQVQYLRDYCKAHPSDTYGVAFFDLLKHMKALSVAKGYVWHSPANIEAPADVRAHVLAMALPMGLTNIEGVLDEHPADVPPGLEFRFAKDKDGKIRPVPDLFMIAFNDSGAALPEFGPNVKILTVVYPRRLTHDHPPSGDDDHDLADDIPAFYIGARGRDVWEIGKNNGVASIRIVNTEGTGPWEKFQSDPSKYVYYSQHFLNGRTAEQNFADPKVAKSPCVRPARVTGRPSRMRSATAPTRTRRELTATHRFFGHWIAAISRASKRF